MSHLLPPKGLAESGRESGYLGVGELAVLEVLLAVQGPDAGVCVVVGVFTHTVWETLLKMEGNVTLLLGNTETNLQNQGGTF